MRHTLLALCFISMLTWSGCRSADPPLVAVEGDSAELAALTGEWSGYYESTATGREGSITFHLTPDPAGAHGDVVMLAPRSMTREINRSLRYEQEQNPADPAALPDVRTQVLSIHFVRISGGEVAGEMEPYTLPGENNVLTTRFVGRIRGNRIRGTFETIGGTAAATTHGTWTVRKTSS
jgi:hypothetical protein